MYVYIIFDVYVYVYIVHDGIDDEDDHAVDVDNDDG